jgi:hypothetical protein
MAASMNLFPLKHWITDCFGSYLTQDTSDEYMRRRRELHLADNDTRSADEVRAQRLRNAPENQVRQ